MIKQINYILKKRHVLLKLSFNKNPIPSEFFEHFPKVKDNFKRDFWGRVTEIEVLLKENEVLTFLQRLVTKGYADVDTPLFKSDEDEPTTLGRFLPPPLPETVIKGYSSEGYWTLIQSLPCKERNSILEELKLSKIIKRANKLEVQLANNDYICADTTNTRITFLAALLCVQQNKIEINQLATLHLLDSAIQTLYLSPCSYLIYNHAENKKIHRTYAIFPVNTTESIPSAIRKFKYNEIPVPQRIKSTDLPERMQHPLVQRFFNFTQEEWIHFHEEMKDMPHTEQFAHVLIAPEFGCWSSIIFTIQKHLKCMKVLDWVRDIDDGIMIEKIMLVPSFSMFQAAINVKARALGRSSLQLLPTYGYLDPELYARLKSVGCIPVAMYLPEKKTHLRYNSSKGGFRNTVDGHPAETAFAGAIHDVYHALRELCMTDKVASARIRLADIAKVHPQNKLSSEHPAIDQILIDGELTFNYDLSQDTVFEKEHRPNSTETFGDLFYTTSVAGNLHDDLKRAFIYDMVLNKEDWLLSFELGKTDLRPCDQDIYDEIEAEFLESQYSFSN